MSKWFQRGLILSSLSLFFAGCFTTPETSKLRCTKPDHCPKGYACVISNAGTPGSCQRSAGEAGVSDAVVSTGDAARDRTDATTTFDGAETGPRVDVWQGTTDTPLSPDLAEDQPVSPDDLGSNPPSDGPRFDSWQNLNPDLRSDSNSDSRPDSGQGPDTSAVCVPKARNCSSSADNNCNGTPDNQETAYCTCAVGTPRPCQEHPNLDGKGICKAGTQTCVASADGSTSSWGGCTGSVGPSVESCFNGADDDCNGLTDCADSACTAVAMCVEDAPGFALGTLVDPSADCPSRYTEQATGVGQGAIAVSTACAGCTCSGEMSCTGTLVDTGTTATNCGDNTIKGSWSSDTTSKSCGVFASPMPKGNNFKLTLSAKPTCTCSGTPSLAPSSFPSNRKFCRTGNVGRGCSVGRVCVPSGPTKHCAMATGSLACTGNYAVEGSGSWYTGITDTRSCGTACSPTAPVGGTCGNSILYLNSTACATTPWYDEPTPFGGGCFTQDGPIVAAGFKDVAVAPTCPLANAPTGPTPSATGTQSICCL